MLSTFSPCFFKEGTLKQAGEAARVALHKLADEVLPGHGDVQCIVEIGSIYEKTLEASKVCDADLIVVGAHKPDLADRIIGLAGGCIVFDGPPLRLSDTVLTRIYGSSGQDAN